MTFRKLRLRALFAACFFAVSAMFFVGCGSKKDKDADSAITLDEDDLSTYDGKILEGISIEGTNVGGMDANSALEALKSANESKLQNMTLTLQYGTQSWQLSANDLGISYDYEASISEAFAAADNIAKDEKKRIAEQGMNIPLQLLSSPTGIDSALSRIAGEINKEPVEPSAEFTPEKSERFTYSAGQPGMQLDMAASLQTIQSTIDQGNFPAMVQLIVQTTQPSKSLEDLKVNTQRITTATTSYESKGKENRTFNLKKGVEILHGTVVKPGREFSFNETTGPRDEKNGWKQAPTIVDGTMFEDDFGGGICQVSTTMFNAVYKAGLEVTERNKHSIPSSYVPLGLDAMVSYGAKDFRFVNNTDYPIYITATCEGGSLTFAVWGRPLPDGQSIKLRSETDKEIEPGEPEIFTAESLRPGEKETVRKAKSGYEVTVYKDTYDANGEKIDSTRAYRVSYAPINAVIRVGEGSSSSSNESNDSDSSDSDSGGSGTTTHDGFDIPEEGN